MTVITGFNHISPGANVPSVVNGIVEIPKGCRSKFEFDKHLGVFKLDRYLFSSAHYPGDYGFIPQTLAEDNDPLDILVMVNEPTFPGCLIESRVVGMFNMKDRGLFDRKILAVPHKDPLFGEYRELESVPNHFLREFEHFFATYKQLEGVEIETIGWSDRTTAIREVVGSIERYRTKVSGIKY